MHIHIQCVLLQGEDDDHIKPKAQSLKNPQFLTHNGCAEYYPIWKTPFEVSPRGRSHRARPFRSIYTALLTILLRTWMPYRASALT